MLKLLNFSCSRCSFPSDHSDHFLVNINSFEGQRYGVPYWYVRRECRVSREGRVVHIYSDDLSRELVACLCQARAFN